MSRGVTSHNVTSHCIILQGLWQEVSLYGEADAYNVIYSVADRETFDDAVDIMYEIRQDPDRERIPIILVANKTDMVRNRLVTQQGKTTFLRYMMGRGHIHKSDKFLISLFCHL